MTQYPNKDFMMGTISGISHKGTDRQLETNKTGAISCLQLLTTAPLFYDQELVKNHLIYFILFDRLS